MCRNIPCQASARGTILSAFFPRPIRQAPPLARALYFIGLTFILIVWLLPLLAVALTSVRPLEDIQRGEFWSWPSELRLIENYGAVFTSAPMARFLFNSLLISLPAVTGAVALSCMAGFALAKYRFPGCKLLFVFFVAGNLVPFQILMLPVRQIMVDLDLYDTRWALILFHAAFQTGFCTLFMRNFIRELPDALLDQARIDGWGELRIFWHIVVPLVRPAIAAVGALVFTFVWNDFFWSLVLVHSDAVRPVTAGLQALRGMWVTSWHLVSAASLLAAMPPVVVFFVMQRQFIAGLTSGAGEP